jgi:GNAT superfamily N-acetyltransferase
MPAVVWRIWQIAYLSEWLMFHALPVDQIRVGLADPHSAESQQLLAQLSATLQGITGSSGTASFDVRNVTVEGACFVIARSGTGAAVGCGAIRPLDPGVAEIKRMFAMPGSQGAGKAILCFLEAFAGEAGYQQIWLETRKVNQRAVSFYERNGYRIIANYGRYIGRPEAVCFAKTLRTKV